jgi:hypothetical protein
VILSETELRYKKEVLPMKKEQAELDSWVVHMANSKTPTESATCR